MVEYFVLNEKVNSSNLLLLTLFVNKIDKKPERDFPLFRHLHNKEHKIMPIKNLQILFFFIRLNIYLKTKSYEFQILTYF